MHRGIVCLLWGCLAFAQIEVTQSGTMGVAPQPPIAAALQAYWKARNNARFDEAAAKREDARNLFRHVPVDAPEFGNWVQNIGQIYDNTGMSAQARAIAEEALARAEALGESHPARIMLLNRLADLWLQDRNLLKSLGYREKAVAAIDAAPHAQSSPPAVLKMLGAVSSASFGPFQDTSSVYLRLADLYQQLGRPGAIAALLAKLRARNNDANDVAIASLYARQGQFDEAAAMYKKQAEQFALDPQAQPWQRIGPLQSLANLYRGEQRYDDAAAALQQAIAVLDASGKPEAHNQVLWISEQLAGLFHQAGQLAAADQVYQQLLTEAPDGRDDMYRHVLTSYANYLGLTKRGAEGLDLLRTYLANHSALQPAEESSILFSLANVAQLSRQTTLREEYQRAAIEKQQAAQTAPPGQVFIAKLLQNAHSAANAGNLDEAFNLAMKAMDTASLALDRDQVAFQVPSLAAVLANKKASDKAEQLYQRLFGLVQSWSSDAVQPLLTVMQNYPRFLMQQNSRWEEVPDAIDRYRTTLITARGADTGWLEDVVRLTIDFERQRGSLEMALPAAQNLVALEESLDGNTSEPYLHALETLADIYVATDPGRTLALRRQTVVIGDLVYSANDTRRGFTRINAALALAQQGQFEEAEDLASEAVAIGRRTQPNFFTSQLEQIRQMRFR
jgi:tetratricopeptide (TPR) repeat protein